MSELLSGQRSVRWRTPAGAAVVLMLLAAGIAVLVFAMAPRGSAETVDPARPTAVSTATAEAPSNVILIHVLGAVERPGLYELSEGARAVDAIAAAGGLLDTADQAQLNLARFVADAEQVYVPAIGEIPAAPPGETAGKVNINTADAATLETLPRVGPVMAANILEWREKNGRFAVIEDLMNITGMGEKTFESLKELVTV